VTGDPRGPLEHLTAELAGRGDTTFQIAELRNLAQVGVRVDPAERGSLALPLEPNTFLRSGDRTTLWLGPDEWLVLADAEPADAVVEQLGGVLGTAHRSILDLSTNRVVLELRGDAVGEVLATDCPLDLHPRAWTPGRCAQTLVMGVPSILARHDDATWLLVRPSFAEHVVDRLLDAADLVREGA
jgi:sarcosine oxidase subunit gamma